MDDFDDDEQLFASDAGGLGGAVSCEQCGSTDMSANEVGELVCQICGAQSQDVRNMVQENLVGAGGMRTSRGGLIVRRQRAQARVALPTARDAFTVSDFLRALQLVLSQGVEQLVAHCGAPAQLRGVVKELWRRYLDHWVYAEAPPVYVVNGRMVASTHPLYYAQAAAAGKRPAACPAVSMPLLLALLYIGCRWLGLPFLPHDICSWVRNGTIRYLNCFGTVLDAQAQASLLAARLFLSPVLPPSPGHLARLSSVLAASVGVALPPLNATAAAYRLVAQAKLPVALLPLVAQLGALHDLDRLWGDVYGKLKGAGGGGGGGWTTAAAAGGARTNPNKRRRPGALQGGDGGDADAHSSSSSSEEESDHAPGSRGRGGNRRTVQVQVPQGASGHPAATGPPASLRPDRLALMRASPALDPSSAACVAALVAVALRLLCGWEGWVDAHLQPGLVGDLGAQRHRMGLTNGPWATPHLLDCCGVDGGGGGGGGGEEEMTLPPRPALRGSSAAAPALQHPRTRSSSSASLSGEASGLLPPFPTPQRTPYIVCRDAPFPPPSGAPDIPFPPAPAAVELMPPSLTLPFVSFTSATALSGGDLGLGRGEAGYPRGGPFGSPLETLSLLVDTEGGRGGVSGLGDHAVYLQATFEAAQDAKGGLGKALAPRGARIAAFGASADFSEDEELLTQQLLIMGSQPLQSQLTQTHGSVSSAAPDPAVTVREDLTVGVESRAGAMKRHKFGAQDRTWGDERALEAVAMASDTLRAWGLRAGAAAAAAASAAVSAGVEYDRAAHVGTRGGSIDYDAGLLQQQRQQRQQGREREAYARRDSQESAAAGGGHGDQDGPPTGPARQVSFSQQISDSFPREGQRGAGALGGSSSSSAAASSSYSAGRPMARPSVQSAAPGRQGGTRGGRAGHGPPSLASSSSIAGAAALAVPSRGSAPPRQLSAPAASNARRQGGSEEDETEEADNAYFASDSAACAASGTHASSSSSSSSAAAASAPAPPPQPLPALAPDIIFFPRTRQPLRSGAAHMGHVIAPRPLLLDVRYAAVLRMLSCIVDVSVDGILAHADALELMLQLYVPLPEVPARGTPEVSAEAASAAASAAAATAVPAAPVGVTKRKKKLVM